MLLIMRKLILIVLISLMPWTVFAEDGTGILSQLLKNMHSMQADFSQTIVDKKGNTVQKSTGHMALQRPSQFRWDVQKPIQQLIVTNGKKLWIYDPDLEQVTIRSLVKAAGETPAMLLSDENLSLTKEFTVKPIHDSYSSLQWFLLIPKDKGSMVLSLKLGFEKQVIRAMQLQDHLGHTTLIEFHAVKLNSPLQATLFSFKAPKDVDVIDETKR